MGKSDALSHGKDFDGGVCHLRSLGFLTFSILCYVETNAVFQKWCFYIPEWKVKEASDWYGEFPPGDGNVQFQKCYCSTQ